MSQLLTANKVNNVWQLSRLNDPRETRADPGYNRSRSGGAGFLCDYFCCRLVKDRAAVLTQCKMRIVNCHTEDLNKNSKKERCYVSIKFFY